MSDPRKIALVVALVALYLVAPGRVASVEGNPSADLVSVEIDAPPELQGFADRLATWDSRRLARFGHLLGLPGPSSEPPIAIRVVLAPESAALDLGAPRWVAGYARADSSIVVLFPSRVPVYPYGSLEELLGHEVAHVLISRAAGGRSLPRWFHEGLSMLAEEAWGLGDRSRVALAVLRQGRHDLAALDRRFGDPRQVARAYALAGAFVRDLVNRYGGEFPAELLRAVAAGEEFPVAFEAATGSSLGEAEDSFWRRFTFWYRWLPFLTSSTALWMAIVLLALLAIRRRRRRDRLLKEQWDLEEAWEAERLRRLRETAPPDDESLGPIN
ncbi:MAG: hypothetical protein GY769_22190 [bacterium]|nr:hypothetical protein [bacterium]